MYYPRKLKPSVDTPPPEPPAELARMLVSQRDPRALVAMSSAIALSITSAFDDTRNVPSDGVADEGRDASLRTAYAAVRMAVDVVKESSDMFPPLKTVVGAVSALMKNCEVSTSHLRTEGVLIPLLYLILANCR